MANVKKRTGKEEEFNRSKLETSLKRAGASESTAREVASRFEAREGLSTRDIRTQALSELQKKEAPAAERYERTRRLTARASEQVMKDAVRMHPDTMKHFGLSSGASVMLEHAGKTYGVRVEESSQAGQREMHLHNEALRAIEAPKETRVAVRKETR